MSKALKVQINISGEGISQLSVFNLEDNSLLRQGVPADEFAAEAADVEMSAAIVRSRVKLLSIRSTVNVTVKTNSTSQPGNTLTLNANEGLLWFEGIGYDLSDLLSADVTKLYFTNLDTESAGSVEVIVLADATINDE